MCTLVTPNTDFLIFHEIDFATNTPSVLFTRTIFGSLLYLQMPFYYRYCNAEFGVMNCLKNKLDVTH